MDEKTRRDEACKENEDFHEKAAELLKTFVFDTDPHPVDPLIEEHEVILAMRETAEVEVARTRSGGKTFDPVFWKKVADFLARYADACHHGKEEDLLFPVLLAQGIPDEGGPIGVMKNDHMKGRALRAGIQEGAEAGDMDATFQAAEGIISLLREHIACENHVLFQLARRIVPENEVTRLLNAYEKVETPANMVDLARRFCERNGVDFDEVRGTTRPEVCPHGEKKPEG